MMPPRTPVRVPPTIAAAWLLCLLHTGKADVEGAESGDGDSCLGDWVAVATGLGTWRVALRGVVTRGAVASLQQLLVELAARQQYSPELHVWSCHPGNVVLLATLGTIELLAFLKIEDQFLSTYHLDIAVGMPHPFLWDLCNLLKRSCQLRLPESPYTAHCSDTCHRSRSNHCSSHWDCMVCMIYRALIRQCHSIAGSLQLPPRSQRPLGETGTQPY